MYQLAKYATATTIYFSVVKRGVVDLAQTADWTPATGDTKVSINGGTLANTTNNPAIVAGTNGVLWSLALTTGELTGADIRIQIVDSATKAIEDQSLAVYTYGNASAKFVADYSVAALGAVMPTTAGRTLDVSAGGEAGVDWANVGSPTTTLNLSGTSTKALEPTTAGRTLDVTTTGEAGLDFDNILLTNGSSKAGIKCSGTLSGTHSTTTADLGTNAPADDIGGCVLVIPTRGVYNAIDSYNTGTGVATFSPALASNTLTDGDVYYVFFSARSSTGSPPTVLLSSGTGAGQISLSSGTVTLTDASLTAAKFGTGAITASAIAADAIGASELAADAVTEIQAGLLTAASANTTRYQKNTASQKVFFTLVDSTDHVSRKTGITVTAQRSLDGAAFGSATGTVTEVGNGVYYLSASAADTNADDVVFRLTGTACDPVELHVVTF